MYAAAHKIQIFDLGAEIGVPHEGGHALVGTRAVQGPQVRPGFAFDAAGLQHFFAGNQAFQIHLQNSIDFGDDVSARAGDDGVPILPSVVGHIDHHKPVFTTLRRIARTVLGRDVDVHRRIITDLPLAEQLEFLLVIFAEQNIVHVQLRKIALDPPVKDQRRGGFFLPQDLFRLGCPGQQTAVSVKHVHVADDLIVVPFCAVYPQANGFVLVQ